MIEWLETYLDRNCDSLLVVSHDRDFLDNVCNEIIELEDGKLFYYSGNYEYYVEKKAERKELESLEVSKAKNLFRKELEWMRRQPKARTTKAKSRIDAYYDLKETASKNLQEKEMKADIKITRLGGKIVEFHHVHKKFGDQNILNDFSYKFKTGERVGIAGKNGVGKTTFPESHHGDQKPDTGKIVTGETVQFRLLYTKRDEDRGRKRVIEVIRDIADFITLKKGKHFPHRSCLNAFSSTGTNNMITWRK
jgi:ATP-binding cassette subfamily F protein uup